MINIGISITSRASRKSESKRLIDAVNSAVGPSNVMTQLDADDAELSGATIGSWPARVGTTASPLGTGRASKSVVLDRGAVVFTKAAGVSQAYSLATGNTRCVVVVARFDGTVPLADNIAIVGGQSIRLLGVTGASALVASGTTYKDGAVSSVIDTSPHCWIVQSAAADTNPFGIGGANNSVAYTFNGPVWYVAQLSTAPDASQRTAILAAVKRRYPFLP